MSVTLHTNLGDLKFELHCSACPKAATNFIGLCAKGYYNDCLFTRNIKGFILQGGTKTGKYSKDESFYGRAFEDELTSNYKHDKRGVLSFANKGPNTNKSQFFITYTANSQLDLNNTIFGHLISGFDTLDLIEMQPVNESYKPNDDIIIQDVTIHANPFAE